MNREAMPLALLAVAFIGYLLGSIPFGLLLTKAAGLGDIRKVGSGNIGATNVLRTGRKGLAAGTLILDAAKGAVAVLLGGAVFDLPGVLFAGVACVLGHLFPIWLRFKGGKGVATGLGILLAASPLIGLACCGIWLLAAWWSRISSVAALSAFAAAPILAAVTVQPLYISGLAMIIAVMVFIRHEENIRRLFSGDEPQIGEKP